MTCLRDTPEWSSDLHLLLMNRLFLTIVSSGWPRLSAALCLLSL